MLDIVTFTSEEKTEKNKKIKRKILKYKKKEHKITKKKTKQKEKKRKKQKKKRIKKKKKEKKQKKKFFLKTRAMLTPQVHVLLPGNAEDCSVAEMVSKT